MRIWFDLSNSPHINLFQAMIRELQREHEVVITCRPLANTIDLLDLHGMPYHVVGRHYGDKLASKLLGYGVRVHQLRRFLKPRGIDVAISQSSFHSPVVARMLGVRCIYLNDNEHAMGNVPAFLCAHRIMVPEYFSHAQLRRQYAHPARIVHYPGIKEGIYLWRELVRTAPRPGTAQRKRPSIYLRPEPWTAQYYKGKRNFLDDLILGLASTADVTVLPRGAAQSSHYRQPKFERVRIVSTALDLADIAPDCDLFIGAGGTMTREMAVLGVPTISLYQDRLLAVDQYLLSQEALVHRMSLTANEAMSHLDRCARRPPRMDLLEKGKVAYDMIKAAITESEYLKHSAL